MVTTPELSVTPGLSGSVKKELQKVPTLDCAFDSSAGDTIAFVITREWRNTIVFPMRTAESCSFIDDYFTVIYCLSFPQLSKVSNVYSIDCLYMILTRKIRSQRQGLKLGNLIAQLLNIAK